MDNEIKNENEVKVENETEVKTDNEVNTETEVKNETETENKTDNENQTNNEVATEVKSEPSKAGKKSIGLIILIIVLCVALLGGGGYVVYDKFVGNKPAGANGTTTTAVEGETTTTDVTTTEAIDDTTTTTTTTTAAKKETSKKIDIKKYCTEGGDCNKTIGELDFSGKKVNLRVEFEKFNVAGASGSIYLQYMREKDWDINKFLPSANNYYTTNGYLNIDGFEVYKNYFIVYLILGSDGEKTDVPACTANHYAVYILDQYLNELAYFESYQSGRPLLTTKFEDDYVYYRGLTSVSDTDERTKIVMKKESIDNIIDPPCLHDCEEESAVIVSDVKEC